MLHTGSPSGCTCPVQSVSPSFQQLWKLWIAFSVIFSTSTLKSPSSFCLKKTCTSSAGRAFPTETTEMGDELTALLLPHVQFQCLHIFSQFFGYRMFLSTSEQSYLTVFVDLCTTGFSWASCLWSQPPIPVSKASQFPLPTYLLSLCCLALSATHLAPFKLQQNIWRFLIHLFARTLMTSSHRNTNFTVHFDFAPSGSEISHSNQQVFLKVYTNLHVCLNSKRQEVTVQSKRHSFVWTL